MDAYTNSNIKGTINALSPLSITYTNGATIALDRTPLHSDLEKTRGRLYFRDSVINRVGFGLVLSGTPIAFDSSNDFTRMFGLYEAAQFMSKENAPVTVKIVPQPFGLLGINIIPSQF